MHGIDGRWHDEPPLVEPLPPIRTQPAPAFTAGDVEELRFTLKEMFLATTIAAVMLALFRSIGIFGAVLSFLSAAIITLLVIPEVFPKNLPRQRLVFDFVWGMVMPIVCLVFDPFIFKNGGDPVEIFEPSHSIEPAVAKVQIYDFAYFAWPFLAGQMATLGMVLAWGKSLRRIAPFLAGVLATGSMVAVCIGVLLALPAALGTFAFGIGLLGFTPFFTSYTFFRRMRLMWNLSGDWTPQKIELLLGLFGILLSLLLPVLVGAAALSIAPPAKGGPFPPSWLDD
jgi:hypothetical protein